MAPGGEHKLLTETSETQLRELQILAFHEKEKEGFQETKFAAKKEMYM